MRFMTPRFKLAKNCDHHWIQRYLLPSKRLLSQNRTWTRTSPANVQRCRARLPKQKVEEDHDLALRTAAFGRAEDEEGCENEAFGVPFPP